MEETIESLLDVQEQIKANQEEMKALMDSHGVEGQGALKQRRNESVSREDRRQSRQNGSQDEGLL